MNNSNNVKASNFDNTLKNAVAALSHVWAQIYALKGKLDADLPMTLKTEGFQTGKIFHVGDDTDAVGGVQTALVWGYEISVPPRGSGKGKRRSIGWVYLSVRISPISSFEISSSTFIPYISIHIDHIDCGFTEDLKDFVPPASYSDDDLITEGWKSDSIPQVSDTTLGTFRCVDDDGLSAAVIYIPLKALTADNVDKLLLKPISQLAKECRDTWRTQEGG
jgi:hypothetical protein